jgi:hypothetical protein
VHNFQPVVFIVFIGQSPDSGEFPIPHYFFMGPGKSLKTDWPVRLIKGGDYRVVVSVTGRGSREVFTSSTIQFHVREKPALETKMMLPVVAGVSPFFIVVWLIVNEVGHGRK